MDPSELYDADSLPGPNSRAALRAARGASNSLDLLNLAEEIESLGRRDVREVESLIRQILPHSLKVDCEPEPTACPHRRVEIVGFQADARSAFVIGVQQSK